MNTSHGTNTPILSAVRPGSRVWPGPRVPAVLCLLFVTMLCIRSARGQQGGWHSFGWNPPVIVRNDSLAGGWTRFGQSGTADTALLMRPVPPVVPYRRWPLGSGSYFRFHLNLDLSWQAGRWFWGSHTAYAPWLDPWNRRAWYRLPPDTGRGWVR